MTRQTGESDGGIREALIQMQLGLGGAALAPVVRLHHHFVIELVVAERNDHRRADREVVLSEEVHAQGQVDDVETIDEAAEVKRSGSDRVGTLQRRRVVQLGGGSDRGSTIITEFGELVTNAQVGEQ